MVEGINELIQALKTVNQIHGREGALKMFRDLQNSIGFEQQALIFETLLESCSAEPAEVRIVKFGDKKIDQIKCVRAHTGTSLKGAKDIVDSGASAPVYLKFKTNRSAEDFVDGICNNGGYAYVIGKEESIY